MSLEMEDRHIKIVIQEHFLEKRVNKSKDWHIRMCSILYVETWEMTKWRYGAFNRSHQNTKSSKCYCKKKGKYYTFKSIWKPHKNKYSKIYQPKHHHKVPYLKKQRTPSKKVFLYNCQNPGNLANECPLKKKNPILSTLFIEYLELEWLD
jgi:hypothetical protein